MYEHTADLKYLIEEIIEKEFPSNYQAFKLEGDDLINEYINKGKISSAKIDSTTSGAIPELSDIIPYITLIKATIDTAKGIKDLIGSLKKESITKPQIEELKSNWASELTNMGLDEQQSKEVSSKYIEKMIRILSEK